MGFVFVLFLNTTKLHREMITSKPGQQAVFLAGTLLHSLTQELSVEEQEGASLCQCFPEAAAGAH